MKHAYKCLLLSGLLLAFSSAHAQTAWRPFRPGLIYAYGVPNSTGGGMYATAGIYTLRLDSAYVTAAGDSAWAFNRVLRELNGRTPGDSYAYRFRRSRNNLFGQRLLWRPGSTEYTLETLSEGSAQTGAGLRLRPRAAVGSTWAASAASGVTATLTGRSLQTVSGLPDTVATIALSTGAVVRLSRRFGLLEGPQWLALGSGAVQWVATQLPTTLAQSVYSPLRLFDLHPGDELGYVYDPITFGPFPCSVTHTLRRVLTRIQTADSLFITYREQSVTQSFGYPTCGAAGIYPQAAITGRWAFSLRTGKSAQFVRLSLLTGEYPVRAGSMYMGRGIVDLQPGGSGCSGTQQLVYDHLFGNGSMNEYGPVADYDSRQHFSAALGLGAVKNQSTRLEYYRRTRNGLLTTCGIATPYANLLPTRAAQAAAVGTLFPNPATETATLALAAPAKPGTRLVLRDALGRAVWQQGVATGQIAVAVPLVGQPAGVYLLRVERPEAAGITLRLVKK